jgi:hypothetical protein
MDLIKQDTRSAADGGAWLHLRGVDGVKLYADDREKKRPMRVRLLGKDSDPFRKHSRKLINEGMEARRKNQTSKSAEELEEVSIEMLIACTTDCENLMYGKKLLKCEPEDLQTLFQIPIFGEQAGEFINDRENYLGN